MQNGPFYRSQLELVATVVQESEGESHISISLPISQRKVVSPNESTGLTATYLSGSMVPTAFLAVAPTGQPQNAHPPILALRKFNRRVPIFNGFDSLLQMARVSISSTNPSGLSRCRTMIVAGLSYRLVVPPG